MQRKSSKPKRNKRLNLAIFIMASEVFLGSFSLRLINIKCAFGTKSYQGENKDG